MSDKILHIDITDEDIKWAESILPGISFDDCRKEILKNLESVDIHACPGSGKTTLLVAKLAILAKTDENEKLSIKDVSDELGVAELTVHNYIKKGILPALKIGRRVFIKRTDLENALKEVKSLKYKRF